MTQHIIEDASACWYAVQSKPRQEERAEADLLAWGVEAFLPRIRGRQATVRRAARSQVHALFPGYLFAKFDERRMLHKVRYTRGVARVLGAGAQPTRVDDSIIELIRGQVGIDGYVRLALTPGDRVRIMEGPLKDFVGVFSSTVTAADRVRVLLTAVNGRFSVVVDRDALEKTTAA